MANIFLNDFIYGRINPYSDDRLFIDFNLESIVGESEKALKCVIYFYDMRTNEQLTEKDFIWIPKSQIIYYEHNGVLYINELQLKKHFNSRFYKKSDDRYKQQINSEIDLAKNKIYY